MHAEISTDTFTRGHQILLHYFWLSQQTSCPCCDWIYLWSGFEFNHTKVSRAQDTQLIYLAEFSGELTKSEKLGSAEVLITLRLAFNSCPMSHYISKIKQDRQRRENNLMSDFYAPSFLPPLSTHCYLLQVPNAMCSCIWGNHQPAVWPLLVKARSPRVT